MILALLVILFTLLIFVFLLFKKNIYSPSILLIIGYISAVFFYLLNRNNWNNDLSWFTIFIIFIGIFAFSLSELFSKSLIQQKKIVPKKINYIRVSIFKTILITLFGLVTLFFLFRSISQISGIPFGDLSAILGSYKEVFLDTGENFGLIINLLVKTAYAFSFIYLYLFVSNSISKNSIRGHIIYLIPVFIGIIITIFLSNRLTLILYFLFSIISFSLIKNRKTGGRYTVRIRSYFTILFLVLGFFYLFYILAEVVGRINSYNFIDYISIYVGSSIPNLNNYLNSGTVVHRYYFQEIFPGLINSFANIGLLQSSVTKVLEFRSIGDNIYSNVYSGLRRMFNSGGLLGVIIFQFIYGFVLSTFYYHLKNSVNQQNVFGIKVIIFCKLVYTIPLQAVEEHFFINVFSFGYILETIILIICYIFLINVRFLKKDIFMRGDIK